MICAPAVATQPHGEWYGVKLLKHGSPPTSLCPHCDCTSGATRMSEREGTPSPFADCNRVPPPSNAAHFRCVAVDIHTHEEVIMDSCELELAMRASMAIPGAFKPVKWKGRTLVDGGMLNNLPVDVVRVMGADVVIAIDLDQVDHADRDFSLKEEFGIGGLLDWLVSRPDWKKLKANREDADVYIRPNLWEFGVSSFSDNSIDVMILRGEEAARKAKDELLRLRDSIYSADD